MERITQKMLEIRVKHLNEITGNPVTSYTRTDSGMKANPGNYHLDFAYGGVALEQMSTEGGGVHDIFGGHMPKRELFERLTAYIAGIEEGQKLAG